MIYFLRDDLGRIVGQIERPRGAGGIVEYGGKDRDRVLHVAGRARAIPPSSLSRTERESQEYSPARLWD